MATVVGLAECARSAVDQDAVRATRAALPPPEESQQLGDLFRLLADPTRVRLLLALLGGDLCVCDLAASVDASESSVSHALRLLRTAGVVRSRRSGRRVFYALDDEHVRLVLGLSRAHLRHQAAVDAPATSREARV